MIRHGRCMGSQRVAIPPSSETYLQAVSYHPPLHPPSLVSQSTTCCSLIWTVDPYFSQWAASMEAVAPKAQQDPHCPWSLISVIAPESLQSTLEAIDLACMLYFFGAAGMSGMLKVFMAMNSS